MLTKTLQDGTESFQVSVHQAAASSPVVLVAAGAGGLPGRYATLLRTLAESGCRIIAPHFERLTSPSPTEGDLTLRARRLVFALDAFAYPDSKIVGVGHSIGATTLAAMAGAHMWLGSGQHVNIAKDNRLNRLVLLAPPTGFFRAPAALDELKLPILLWVGSADTVTPPDQTKWLAKAIRDWNSVEVRITEGAGHFSFMDNPPPQTTEPLANKQAFLEEYSNEICKFVTA